MATQTRRDPQGNNPETSVTTYQFDEHGYITQKQLPNGDQYRYTMNSLGRIEQTQVYAFQGASANPQYVLAGQTTYTYQNNGLLLSQQETLDNGEVITTTWTYEGNQKSSEEVVSSGAPTEVALTQWFYNSNYEGLPGTLKEKRVKVAEGQYQSTHYTYNGHGAPVTITLPDGHTITLEYGAAYNGLYPTKVTHNGFGTQLQTRYDYDAQGNITQVTDANGNIEQSEYDQSNRLIKTTNALGHITRYQYDSRGNLIQLISDRTSPNDQLDHITLTYNSRNLLEKIQRQDASGTLVTLSHLTYDSEGNVHSVTNSLNQTSTFAYDVNQRLIQLSNYKNETLNYTLDVWGNQIQQQTKDSSGAVVQIDHSEFDTLGRMSAQIGAQSNEKTQYQYNALGAVTKITDALNRQTNYNYDLVGQLLSEQDADNQTTSYEYNSRGWLEKVTDPRLLVTQYTYNALGQKTQQSSPDSGTTSYTYNPVGQLQTLTDARSVVSNYTYDELNRLKSISYPDSSLNQSFVYDQNTNGLGKLSQITDASGSTDYSYDIWGRLTQVSQQIASQTYSMGYQYDTNNRLTQMTYPSGRVIEYTRDANNEVTGIKSIYNSTEEVILEQKQMMPYGGIKQYLLGNGLLHTQGYDQNYRLTSLQSGSVYSRSQQYNLVDNVIAIMDAHDSTRNQSFDYDLLDRLNDATSVLGNLKYEYDGVGNRTKETKDNSLITLLTYSATANQVDELNGIQSQTVTYDLNGNSTLLHGMTLTYNDANRLSTLVNGAQTANYLYNAYGERTIKIVSGLETQFIYNQNGKVIAEADASGNLIREYVYYQSEPMALIKYGQNAGIYYYHRDHLGTPQRMTDQNQVVVWSADYDAFGQVSLLVETVENPLRFAGQYYDDESGLHYNYHRYYDPSLGRYITSDPIGLNGGLNTYGYVG
ncbi:MAG: RHS domain-containing protein, partial [Gammaproteobacteria bacterium]|nr:RHS domain-containing protein [Gammaproteobacteria bacterium]